MGEQERGKRGGREGVRGVGEGEQGRGERGGVGEGERRGRGKGRGMHFIHCTLPYSVV